MLKLGTAKIERFNNMFRVRWLNHGSFLANEPRYFWNEQDARQFCRERNLLVVMTRIKP